VLPSYNVGDFTWTSSSELLTTEHVIDLFRKAGFTGFEVGNVTIEKVRRKPGKGDTQIPRLRELRIVGRGGEAHPDSGIRLIYRCGACGLIRYSS
jgi:hypothetical protein